MVAGAAPSPEHVFEADAVAPSLFLSRAFSPSLSLSVSLAPSLTHYSV